MIEGLFVLNVVETFEAKHYHPPDTTDIHAHTWKVNVTCATTKLEGGVVVNRSVIKTAISSLAGTLFAANMRDPYTTETIASFLYSKIRKIGVDVKQVAVCEVDDALPSDMQSWALFIPRPPQNVTSGRGIHPDLRKQEEQR